MTIQRFLATLLVAAAFNAGAQQSAPAANVVPTTPPPPAAPREATLPRPVERTVANGLRVIVVTKPNVPLVSARLLIRTGAEAEAEDRAGLAQITADLLTKGTTKRTAEQIARGVEALGASVDTTAGWDYSSVDVNVMSKNLGKAMDFVADVVLDPKFATEEIERVRAQAIDELNVTLSEPRPLAAIVGARVLFGKTAYGHSLSGTPATLAKINRVDLVKFHQFYYRPNNAVLIFAGDVQPETAFSIANSAFAAWKGELPKEPEDTTRPKPPAGTRVVVVDMPDAGQAAVLVGRTGLRRSDPAYYRALVANSVIGGGYSARLNQEIRIKRGLSYGAGSSFDLRRDMGPWIARTETKNESAAEVAGLILDEMNRLATTDVAESELAARKAVLIGSFGRALETGTGIAERVSMLALHGLPLTDINNYTREVGAIGSGDVKRFASENMASSTASVVIVGDAKKFLPALQQRFKQVEVIPFEQLDLQSPELRKN